MIKILFLIHDLGQGGAEKVLVNLVNNLDRSKFDISVTALFGGGVNEQFLKPDIHFRTVFPREIPANSKWMKLFTPKQLHRYCIKGQYDIEVSYLEGPSARIISGCEDLETKLVSWIHSIQNSSKEVAASFRSYAEAAKCYDRFDMNVCVSQYMRDQFAKLMKLKKPCVVMYNTVESARIKSLSNEEVDLIDDGLLRLIAVGSLKEVKGYDRLLPIIKKLNSEGKRVHLYILGTGKLQGDIEKYISDNDLKDQISLLGYQINPYKFIANSDLLVCASYSEGFSTAVTEALIVGTPVCTVDVSGMKEMLGSNNEYGVVTPNDEEMLYQGIKKLIDEPKTLSYYKTMAEIRGETFGTQKTIDAVEKMFMGLLG